MSSSGTGAGRGRGSGWAGPPNVRTRSMAVQATTSASTQPSSVGISSSVNQTGGGSSGGGASMPGAPAPTTTGQSTNRYQNGPWPAPGEKPHDNDKLLTWTPPRDYNPVPNTVLSNAGNDHCQEKQYYQRCSKCTYTLLLTHFDRSDEPTGGALAEDKRHAFCRRCEFANHVNGENSNKANPLTRNGEWSRSRMQDFDDQYRGPIMRREISVEEYKLHLDRVNALPFGRDKSIPVVTEARYSYRC